MFKFATNKLNRKQPEENDARRKLQKDLFAFNKIADQGFPSKPSAMDYDQKLNLLAIGTKSGDIRIYGAPGVELSCYQEVPFPIQRLLFVQGTGQLLSLVERINRNDITVASSSLKCEITYHIILWQIVSKDDLTVNVEKKKEYQIEPKLGRVSAVTLLHDNSHLFIGFESGDIYVFKLSNFTIVPGAIHKEFIIKSLPENLRKNPGAVESLCQHPRKPTKLLIAYNRGLIIIFDFSNESSIDYLKTTNQQIESACFYQSGRCVATSHTDGSFILWDIENGTNSQPNIVYGPFPCRPVNKILVKTVKNNEPFVIFNGGVPRATYADKISISVIQGENNHVAFDFTSKIIDFITIDDETNESNDKTHSNYSYDNPKALFVLLEEEFVAIDLLSDGWPQFKLPYLNSVHSSAIICTHYCNNISTRLYNRLFHIGNQQLLNDYTDKEWPITGYSDVQAKLSDYKDLLLTGHEDGSIRFWDVTNNSLKLLYKLKTADFFQTDCAIQEDNDDENWPPFRKVGTFDPYSDDPKLGIQKIILCPLKEILLIAGTAGQLIVMNMSEKYINDFTLKVLKINIVTDMDGFIWKGHDPLITKDQVKLLPGFQPISIIQLYPPATISALCLNSDWKLISMGTSHGFTIFDYCQQKELLVRCTLDPNVLISNVETLATTAASGAISRRKSLKKSLRESFRKLRRGRSQKTVKKEVENKLGHNNQLNNELRVDEIDHHKPIERQVESREFKQMDDIPPSVIRYMYFVRTYITNSNQLTNSLWVGTNTGIIYIYALQIPEKNNRFDIQVNCILAKEMRLKHRAPVVHIQVIDQTCSPIPELSSFEQHSFTPSATSNPHQNETTANVIPNHKVIICSEEQFKVFQLPALKPFCKFKLTAVEGARVRRIGYTKYISKSDPSVFEYCLSCLSNLGDLSVYSLPNLKRHVQIQCMKQQDINAITSFVFSKYGQAYYLQSPSEFLHISMSASDATPHHLNIMNALKQHQNNKVDNEKLHKTQDEDSNKKRPISKSLPPPIPNIIKDKTITSPTSPPPPIPAPRTSTNIKLDIPTNTKQASSTVITNNKSTDINKSINKALKQTESLLNESSSTTTNTNASPAATSNATITTTNDTVNSTNVPNSKGIYDENREQRSNEETENEQLSSHVENDLTNVDENQPIPSSPSLKKPNIQKQNYLNENNSFNVTDLSLSTSSTYLINGQLSNGAVSTSGISSFQSSDLSGVDLSMDSIVDKFNEEFNDLSTKIKPINEDTQHENNFTNNIKISVTNSCNINKKSAKTEKKINDVELTIDNHHNDELSNHEDSVTNNIKSCSIKHYEGNNNLASSNHYNKIENATKLIENGNKLEYRETAID